MSICDGCDALWYTCYTCKCNTCSQKQDCLSDEDCYIRRCGEDDEAEA